MYYAIDKVLYAYLSMTQYQCNDSIATMQQYRSPLRFMVVAVLLIALHTSC